MQEPYRVINATARHRGCDVAGLHQAQFAAASQAATASPLALVCSLDFELAQRKLTVRELAARAKVTEAAVSKLRRNRFSLIDAAVFEKVCLALDLQPGDLLSIEADTDD